MKDEFKILLNTAMKREIESRAFYEAASAKADNPIAERLFKSLAGEEEMHLEMLSNLSDDAFVMSDTGKEMILELKKSEFMQEEAVPIDIGIRDILLLAIRREQSALEFYSKTCSIYKSKDAKSLCEELTHSEMKHKVKLELMYEDLFYG